MEFARFSTVAMKPVDPPLGGNPEKGRKIFENYIKENPANWLARVAFSNYIIPNE